MFSCIKIIRSGEEQKRSTIYLIEKFKICLKSNLTYFSKDVILAISIHLQKYL